ncbi:unnamed protein product [Merluccius merluccius]
MVIIELVTMVIIELHWQAGGRLDCAVFSSMGMDTTGFGSFHQLPFVTAAPRGSDPIGGTEGTEGTEGTALDGRTDKKDDGIQEEEEEEEEKGRQQEETGENIRDLK